MKEGGSASTTKWNLGTITFDKVTTGSGIKRSFDQKEDIFKPLPEILPTWEHEEIPKSSFLHLAFIAMLTCAWLLFPLMIKGYSALLGVETMLSQPRLAMMWGSLLVFAAFCLLSWYKLNIFQTISYGPAIGLLVFSACLSGLRDLSHSTAAAGKSD